MVGTVLDTVIGLSFVFALTALMVTACVEGIAAATKKRAKWLLRGIRQLFGENTPLQGSRGLTDSAKTERQAYKIALDPNSSTDEWWDKLTTHPLIASLFQPSANGAKTRAPTEIPADLFAKALRDLAFNEGALVDDLPPRLKDALEAILATLPEGEPAALQKAIEDWFSGQMKQVGEAYRRWTKRWAIPIGIGAAVAMNVSTISIAHALYVDQPLRDATVAAATSGALCEGTGDDAEAKAASTRTCVGEEIKKLDDKGLPIGWPTEDPDTSGWKVLMVLGWILTGLAASFGAPFWFDALKRLSGAKKSLEGT